MNQAERDVMAHTLTTNAELLAGVLRGTDWPGDPVMAALAATRSLDLILDDIVRSLVRQARSEGRSWAEVGDALNVSRQASFQRFAGEAVEERAGGEPIDPLPEADSQALQLLEQFLTEHWEELRGPFDEIMTERCSAELLASVRRKIEEDVAAFVEFGPAHVGVVAGYTVVNVPLVFEGGDRLGRVAFNAQGQVSGFFLLPPEARVMPGPRSAGPARR